MRSIALKTFIFLVLCIPTTLMAQDVAPVGDIKCENVLLEFLQTPANLKKYSSVYIGDYIRCEVYESEFTDLCIMKATLYPRSSGAQKTENFIVALSSTGLTDVFSAIQMNYKEKGSMIELDLKPVMSSKKSEKIQINRKKLQVAGDSGNILSGCLSRTAQSELVKF